MPDRDSDAEVLRQTKETTMEPVLTQRGVTADGIEIEIRPLRSLGHVVVVDGAEHRVHNVRVWRDGGTVTYETKGGQLTIPARLGDPDHTPTWESLCKHQRQTHRDGHWECDDCQATSEGRSLTATLTSEPSS